jgi:tetratricopeptide (TPR) repeat protein
MIIVNRQVFWSLPASFKALLVLMLLLAGPLSVLADTGLVRDKALSRAYVQVALDLSMEADAAASLLNAALEFDPDNSDARYLMARRMLEEGSSIRRSIGELETALAKDAWYYTDPATALLLLVEQYDRLMRYNDMWNTLHTLPESGRTRGDWYYYALRSAVYTGRLDEAEKLGVKGTRMFPRHEEIMALRAEMDPAYRKSLIDKALVPVGSATSEVLLRTLVLSSTADQRPQLVQRYLDLGYEDPQIMILRDFNKSEDKGENGPDIRLLLTEKNLGRLSVFRQIYLIFEEARRLEEFQEFCSRRRIAIHEDRNGDGYDDGIYVLDGGRLTEVRKDLDQDGDHEIIMDFTEHAEGLSLPNSLFLQRGDRRYFFEYGSYPEVLEIRIDTPDTVRKFSFADSVLSLATIDFEHLPPFAGVALQGIPGDEELQNLAYRYIESDNDGTTRHDASGVTVREEKGVIIRILTKGEDKHIERDIDGDGRTEIREIYRDNSLYAVYLDQDGNGTYEYFFYPSLGLHEWDWDQDGEIDYQSYNGD